MVISQVSKEYDISVDTLRYYEKVGLIGPIPRNKSGIRDYSEENLNQINFVKCMRKASLPIDELAKYMKLFKQGDVTISERRKILVNQKEQLENKIKELQEANDRLSYKIELYDKNILEKGIKSE